MRALVFCLLLLGVAAVVVFDIFRVREKHFYALVAKIIAGFVFVLVAVFAIITINLGEKASGVVGNRYFPFILTGLFFGFLGDICLGLKSVIAKYRTHLIGAGIGFFGIGHIFYILAVLLNFEISVTSVLLPVLAAIVTAGGIVFSAPLFGVDYKKLKPYCFFYSVLLSWSMWQAFAAAIVTNFSPLFSVVFIASVLFVTSDLILSHIYFSADAKRLAVSPVVVAFNHATYYGAQYLIALSILLG